MHNALRWFLLWTLFPFVIVAADPPPPLVRSVLSTNLPPFGLTGQALFRTANLPYLDWSNIVQQVIDTNAFQPASANLTNWSLISTNALTGKLDSNVWWAAWGSLSTNALTGKLDSNYWFTVWGAIGTNALTAKLDSNWWWTAYGSKVLTNGGAFIGSDHGNGTNTTFWQSNAAIVPLTIKPLAGSTTNRFEVDDTTGNPSTLVQNNGDFISHNFRSYNDNTALGGNWFGGTNTGHPLLSKAGEFWTASENTGYGDSVMPSVTNAYGNTGMGFKSDFSLLDGYENAAYGNQSLTLLQSGYKNTAIGSYALSSTILGYANTAVGFQSLNSLVGTTYGYKNTALGCYASLTATNAAYVTSVGYQSAGQATNGTHNVNLGSFSGYYNHGDYNVHVGHASGYGGDSVIGFLNANTNSWVWEDYNSVYLGAGASHDTNLPYATKLTNAIAIGYTATVSNNNTVVLGNSDIKTTILRGNVGINTNPVARLQVVGPDGSNPGGAVIFQVVNPMILGQTNLILAKTNGFVGILTDPGYAMDVKGVIVSRGGGSQYLVTRRDTDASAWAFYSSGGDFQFYNYSANADLLTIKNTSGNVGIGTNAPQSRLHVTADNSTANVITVDTTNNHSLLVITTNGLHGFNTNNPQAVFDFFAQSNGPSQYIFRVANGMVAGQTNTFTISTNGAVATAGQFTSGTGISAGNGNVAASAALSFGNGYGITDSGGTVNGVRLYSGGPGLYRASFLLSAANGVGSPSNNLFVAGQLIASNGIVARVHSTYATNVPPLSVEPFTGQATNAMQVLGTNRTTMIVDSNGVTQVNPGGGLNPVGCYGALMMNATNIVVCAGAASVYTNVAGTGYTTIVTNGFYGSTVDALTNLYAGYYRVTVCASAQGANNQATEWEVFTNGVACDLVGMKKTYDAAARMDDLSMTGIIYLPAGCRTDFRVQDGGTGGSISIHRASITVGTP